MRTGADDSFLTLRRKITRWADDFGEQIEAAKPVIPEKLHDRAADNWEPLFQIADLAGGEWATRARSAAESLTPADDNSAEVLLLSDCRDLFDRREYYKPEELHDALLKLEGRPWAEWARGNPITKRAIGDRLRKFGIKSRVERDGDHVVRAYWKTDFSDAFLRYLPDPPELQRMDGHKSAFRGVAAV